jgi:DNA-binding CsgD family transcriptional regulator
MVYRIHGIIRNYVMTKDTIMVMPSMLNAGEAIEMYLKGNEKCEMTLLKISSREEIIDLLGRKSINSIFLKNGMLLTGNEVAVKECLKSGISSKEMAQKLNATENEVRASLLRIYRKIKVKNKSAAIKYFWENEG